MQSEELNDDRANSLILQAYEQEFVNTRQVPRVIEERRKRSHDDFQPRTTWSLLYAFTEVLKDRLHTPALLASLTIKVQGLLYREPITIAT